MGRPLDREEPLRRILLRRRHPARDADHVVRVGRCRARVLGAHQRAHDRAAHDAFARALWRLPSRRAAAHGGLQRVAGRPHGGQVLVSERARTQGCYVARAASKAHTVEETDEMSRHPASPPRLSVITVSTYAPCGPDSTSAASFTTMSIWPVL